MRRTLFTAGFLGLLSTACAFAEDAMVKSRADRVSLYAVPFKCEAAPQIGCGSMSKPVLLELERDQAISEAWLNGSGTLLAVVWSESSDHRSASKVVESILEKNGVSANELAGDTYTEALKSFVAGTDWYRGAEVDALSRVEARTIAQRIIGRLKTSVTLMPEKEAALESGITSAFEHRFFGASAGLTLGSKREQLREDISAVARANLSEKEVAALEAAFAKGILPLPEDNENVKSKPAAPACCRFPAQS